MQLALDQFLTQHGAKQEATNKYEGVVWSCSFFGWSWSHMSKLDIVWVCPITCNSQLTIITVLDKASTNNHHPRLQVMR